MQQAAKSQDFESAAVFRDRLEALTHVLERQQIESGTLGSADIAGLAVDEWGANVQVFVTRDGKLADRRSFTLVNVEGATEEEIFERFVAEYYSTSPTVPTELIVPPGVHEVEALAAFLEGLRGTRVEVRQAERGDKRRLQELATQNAALALAHERLKADRSRERRYGALTSLEQALELPAPPVRIEGFDISNLMGEDIVASMVVFEGGAAKKSDYRKFSMKTTGGQNDVGAMREVLLRRFMRAREAVAGGDYDPSFEAIPDLVMVDGGKPQLGAAVAALGELGLEDAVSVVALAKQRGGAVRALVFGTASRGAGRRRPSAAAAGTRRGPPLRSRVPSDQEDGEDDHVHPRSASGDRGEAQEGDHHAFRVAGAVHGRVSGGVGSRAGSAGQGGKGGVRVCP